MRYFLQIAYYRCGIGNGILRDYDAVCTTTGNLRNNELYDPNNALGDIYNYFASGLIDDPSHMANKPLYVFAGTQNYLFTAGTDAQQYPLQFLCHLLKYIL